MLGDWSISEELADYLIRTSRVLLELGSGYGSEYLTKNGVDVHSVEHNHDWLWQYDTNYIYAPLKNGWYDLDVIKDIHVQYDTLLVDGPPGSHARTKFLEHLHLFNTSHIIIDDCQRMPEMDMAVDIGGLRTFHKCKDGKIFCVIKKY